MIISRRNLEPGDNLFPQLKVAHFCEPWVVFSKKSPYGARHKPYFALAIEKERSEKKKKLGRNAPKSKNQLHKSNFLDATEIPLRLKCTEKQNLCALSSTLVKINCRIC